MVVTDDTPLELGTFHEMWMTDGAPASLEPEDPVQGRRVKLEPPPRGTTFRFFRVEPEDPSRSRKEVEAEAERGFEALGATHCRPDTSRDPWMHRTATVDYIIVLEGEVTLLLDRDEVDLKPFDVVIQRGTNHAWVNRGDEPALLAGILVDGDG